MMHATRREVILGGLLTLVAASPCHAQKHVGLSAEGGCYISPEEAPEYFGRATSANRFLVGTEEIEPRSGNPALDRALAQALAKLARTFDVLPGFAYYRDDSSPNALATPRPLLERTDGTVLFGLSLLQILLEKPIHADASIVAVCAHEFGHIVALKMNLQSRLVPGRDPFRGEQFADYLAGFFAGLRRVENPDYPAVVFATTIGNVTRTTRGSHGTGHERAFAVVEGFKAAFERKVSVAEGTQLGFQFAMSR